MSQVDLTIPAIMTSATEAETIRLAQNMAGQLTTGQHILLIGDLGAGKSVFARAIIQCIFGDIDVPSPTFSLLQHYEDAPHPEIAHFDLYRLEDADEIWELGYEELAESAINIIEWPQIALSFFPDESIVIKMTKLSDISQERRIRIDFLKNCKDEIDAL